MDLRGNRIVVTGGAGFIGSHLCRELLDRGAEVHAFDNFFAGKRSLVPDGGEVRDVDIHRAEVADAIVDADPDGIVHLAAIHYIPYCNEHPEESFRVNVMGTRNVLRGARAVEELKGVVFTSTAAVYPPRDGPNAEDSLVGPIDIYGETKLVGEDLMRLFATDTGVRTASARLFNTYGPKETNPHLVPVVVEQVQDGKRTIQLGNLSPSRDFIHVDDVSRALCAMLTEFDGEYRSYNVGTGVEHSVRGVVQRTSDALGEEIEIEQDRRRIREADREHLRADVTRIREELDWSPRVSLEEGLERLLGQEVMAE